MKPGKLAKSKAGLIIDHPFFATLLLEMNMTEDKSIPTACTDGENISYNPDWIESLKQSEVTFVLAHETLHCVFDHMGRLSGREMNRWNQAADYVINQLLVDEKIGEMPKGALYDPRLVKRGNETAEGVYKLLPKSNEKKGTGDEGGALDSLKPPTMPGTGDGTPGSGKPLDEAGRAKRDADRIIRIKRAEGAARSCGKLSAGMTRLLDEATKPVVDWRAVLRRFMTERAKVIHSFARPKRRFLADDLYLPSLTGERMGAILVAFDCSGSVDDKLLGKFAVELTAIRADVFPARVSVLYFDSDVLGEIETFEAEDEIVISPRGGGGTAFSPIFRAVDAMPEAPAAVIVLTDLECSDFGPCPTYPVLWTVLEGARSTAPWGEILEVESED